MLLNSLKIALRSLIIHRCIRNLIKIKAKKCFLKHVKTSNRASGSHISNHSGLQIPWSFFRPMGLKGLRKIKSPMPTTPKEFNDHAIFNRCPQPCAHDLQTLVLNACTPHIHLKSTACGLNLVPATWFHNPYACIQKCQGLKKKLSASVIKLLSRFFQQLTKLTHDFSNG